MFVMIVVLRYYCPGCRRTVSVLPDFCVPWKRYGAMFIGRVLQLVFVCEQSFRSAGGRFGSSCRIMAGVWARQWSSRASALVTVLQNSFNVKRLPCFNDLYDRPGLGVTKVGVEAFMLCSDLALGRELVGCDGKCGPRGHGACSEDGACRGILPGLQAALAGLPFEVGLF